MPQDGTGGPLRATLSQVGDVWRAKYLAELNPDHPDDRALPDLHIGATEAEVRWWVEQMARGMGYAGVEWQTPQSRFMLPRQMPGRRENLPPGTLPPPHFDRQGDEQRQPSPDDLAETGRVQRELVPKLE